MAGFNKVILIGNLVADPELKTTPSGIAVTTFRIAVGRRFVKQGDEVNTDFFNVVSFRTTAEFVAKYFTKGKPILVVGSIQNRSYTDQQGQKRIFTDIVADECSFVGSSGQGQGQNDGGTFYGADSMAAPASKPAAATFEDISTEDDLPF